MEVALIEPHEAHFAFEEHGHTTGSEVSCSHSAGLDFISEVAGSLRTQAVKKRSFVFSAWHRRSGGFDFMVDGTVLTTWIRGRGVNTCIDTKACIADRVVYTKRLPCASCA
jgi:hypothetical protein